MQKASGWGTAQCDAINDGRLNGGGQVGAASCDRCLPGKEEWGAQTRQEAWAEMASWTSS